MAEYWGVTVADIFNSMPERFRPEGAKDVEAVFGYDIKDEGKWQLTVKNNAMTLAKTDDLSHCVATMAADGETFVGVNVGKVDATNAFISGKFRIEGDMAAFGKTGRLFRKFVLAKKEMTTREYLADMFATIVPRFKAQEAEGLEASFAFDLGGAEGGQWSVFIKDKACTVTTTIEGKPTVTLEFNDARDYVDFILGKIDAQSILAAGKAAAKGDINMMASKWPLLFEKYKDPLAGNVQEQELLTLKKTISINQRFATGPVMGKFLRGLKDKKIYANKCPRCGRLQLPPREVCAECRVRAAEFVEVGPKGEVRYMDVVYYALPDPLTGVARETPYGSINILLDGCKGNETLPHFIRKDQIEKIQAGWNENKGTRVRPVWEENRSGDIWDIKYFEIDE
ncbi:MAG: SCP2 sterol-binding domain-containing protein [Syntrophobacterales bacterium]|nr:SCP2 sterol-binding domain-containing protein [Syntrophobacterales bacterium]